MRILLVEPGPQFSVADVHSGWVGALRRLGVEVVNFNLADRLGLYGGAHLKNPDTGAWDKAFDDAGAVHLAAKGIEAAAFEIWPDVVVVTSGFFVPPAIYELLRARGMRVVLNHLECPYEDDRQVERAPWADLNLVNDPTNLERFRAANPASHYMPAAFDPGLHHPGEALPGLASDFCFVGTGYASRIAFLEAVDLTGLDVALAGNWQATEPGSPLRKHLAHDVEACCDNAEAVDLYRATRASANLYRRECERPELAAGWSMGPREVELAATGTFFLREPRGEGDDVLPMLPTFEGPEDFSEKIRFWLARDGQRELGAARARQAVAGRTFESNARELLRLLDKGK